MNTKTNQNDPEAQEAALLLAVRDFMRLESAGGILLLGAAILAILMANSRLASIYGGLLDTTVAIQVGTLAINKPLVLWINDGLMAIFFFLIGLEIKREVLEGELSSFFTGRTTRSGCTRRHGSTRSNLRVVQLG